MLKCKTCNGTYEPIQADGTRYFHACPPLSEPEVAAALALPADSTTWTKQQKADFAAAARVRPNARDENVAVPASNAAPPKADPSPMKSPGAGTVAVPQMPYEPGPITIEPFPLGPRIVEPGTFADVGREVVGVLGGADAAFQTQQQLIAPILTAEGAGYADEVAPAAAGLDGMDNSIDDAEFGAAFGTLDATATDIATQQRDLPGPDEPDPSTQDDGMYFDPPDQGPPPGSDAG